MAKRPLQWLKGFRFVYKPSKSFLNCMNNALQKEYTEITGKEFDILYLFAERPEDLVYLPTEHAGVLKASIEVYKRNYWGNCLIGWRPKLMDRVVKPGDEIKEGEVEFKWIELSLPVIPETTSVKSDLAKRLGLTINYILKEDNPSDLDIELWLQLADPSIIKSLEQQLAVLQANWNEQADQDTTRQKGYIHSVSLAREEEGEYVFQIDLGSASTEGLKVILNELNNPKWGITQVEII
ncbi:hypothetical protein [Spirosoma aerolatum]|uniref:hypothetical protein n=1 Tax=Spirosoma aerolatum TaxID=1211326 RepID=UPI0012D2B8E6|nr:hypothetical protein [Spirosoma aerolatum]